MGFALVAAWVTSRRREAASLPLARVHHNTMGEAMKIDE
jgi:hypothetical protein